MILIIPKYLMEGESKQRIFLKCLEITYINMVKGLANFRLNSCHMFFKNSYLRNSNQSNRSTILQTFKNYVMIAHHRNYFNNF